MLSRLHLIPKRCGQTEKQTDKIAISISRVNVLTRDNKLEGDSVERIYLRQTSSDGSVNKTIFLSCVSILTRDIDIANLSVCQSVRPSVTFRYQMKTG